MDKHLYDFRSIIVKKKHCKEYWSQWENWNILYKTLAYELSSSRDVESYQYVKNQVFEYFKDYKIHVGENATLDIMNGWWFCFKTLFKINSSRKSEETQNTISALMKKIENINFNDNDTLIATINQDYNLDKDKIQTFLNYLEVVYTIGNIIPVPKGANVHADNFDCWEYKMFKSNKVKYKTQNYIEYFSLEDYNEKEWWNEFKNTDNKAAFICNYMDNRIFLIKNRGSKII